MFARIAHELVGLRADQRGTVAVMMAFLLPILVGGLGLGFEVSNWYLKTRWMQNAADSAAIAAASNGGSNYKAEAKAVAAQYGFVDGSNNVTVIVPDASNALCPTGLNISPPPQCYKVTITSMAPLYLSQVVGYSGNTTVNGVKEKTLSSAATATQPMKEQPICLLALDTTGTALTGNGGPNTNFTGCTVMSNSSASCNGSNLQANYGLAHGTNGGGAGCGNNQLSNVDKAKDPYADILKNNPVGNPCGSSASSYPQEPTKHNDPALPDSNKWSGNSWPEGSIPSSSGGVNIVHVCGDLQLQGTVNINPSTPTVLVIDNGQLDLQSNTLNASNVTVVFTGVTTTPPGNYTHAPTGTTDSSLNIQAPSTGPWSGMAIYQDPALTTGVVDVKSAGNSPEWNITGAVYMPNADVTMSGAINKFTNKSNCFVLAAKDITINGTGSIFNQSPDSTECKKKGLNMPTTDIPGRGQLVY